MTALLESSSTPDDRSAISECSRAGNRRSTTHAGPHRIIEPMWISSGSCTLSAVGTVRVGAGRGLFQRKLMSWNLLSGEPPHEAHLDGDRTASNQAATTRLNCGKVVAMFGSQFLLNVTFKKDHSSFPKATSGHHTTGAQYFSDTSRLLISRPDKFVSHIDLVTDNTPFQLHNEPPLQLLSRPH